MSKQKFNAQGICKYCGKEFYYYEAPSIKTREFCSALCRNKARAKDLNMPCPICGKEFRAISFGSDHGRKRTCGGKCAAVYIRINDLRRRRKSNPNPKPEKEYKHHFWTETEDNFLKAFYPVMGAEWCSNKLSLSIGKTNSHAHRMNLKLNKDAYQSIVHDAAKKYMSGSGNPMYRPEVVSKGIKTMEESGKRAEVFAKLVIAKASILRNKASKVQLRLKKLMEDAHLIFEHEYIIKEKFIVDFAFPINKIIVQVDGCYWHGHNCRFKTLTETQTKQQARDRAQDAYLVKCGWNVIRVWECEVRRKRKLIMSKIINAINQSQLIRNDN